MKQMKHLTAGLLSGLLIFSVAGCSAPSGAASSNAAAASQTTQPTQSSSAAEPISKPKAGKAGDTPSAANGYLVLENMGKEITLDLDGDGKTDTLKVSVKSKEVGSGTNSWTETTLNSIIINGKELAAPDTEEPLKAYKVALDTPDKENYCITDLDTKDHALEIALLDYGPSDDLTTTYLHYKDGTLTSLGVLPGFPNDESSQRDGNGNVMAAGRLKLLQTWYATFPYTLKNGKLEEVEQSQYIPTQDTENVITLKKALTLYAEPDQKADTVKVQPSKDPVTFPATDNKNWVQLHLSDGTEGWFYMNDSSTIVSDGQELQASDVFDNLLLVD